MTFQEASMVWPSGLHSTNPVEWEKNKGFEGKTLVKRHEPSICCTVFCGVQRVILQGDDSDSEEEDDFEEEEEYDVEDDEGFGQVGEATYTLYFRVRSA